MPQNLIGNLPFPPLCLFDEDRAVAFTDISKMMRGRPEGISVCVRYPGGPEKRGGYFFHFEPLSGQEGRFMLYDFEKRPVHAFSAELLVRFINHCTGRTFDQETFNLCQTVLNFLKDEGPTA